MSKKPTKAAAVKVVTVAAKEQATLAVEPVAKPEGSGGRLQAMQNARRNG